MENIKFTHMITLKKKPWFTYATNQEDAINIVKKYGDNVVGVVFAPQGLIMQEVQTEVTLVTPDVKLLDKIVDNENYQIAQEVLEEDTCLKQLEDGGETSGEKSQSPTTEHPTTTT